MLAQPLKQGDTIGIVSPSHIANEIAYSQYLATFHKLGYKTKLGKNIFKDTYGYLASELERADDFNNMIHDSEVKMIFFGGGEGSNEIIPFLDYEYLAIHPKLICSYSDGTTILNAIHSKTGLITYYGQSPSMFYELQSYDFEQFKTNFVEQEKKEIAKNSEWLTVNHGLAEGIIVGGYLRNFALMLNNDYFAYDVNKKYLLLLEDNECFNDIATVSSFISHIEQSSFIGCVSGLIFGHYSKNIYPYFMNRLELLGQKYSVPVIYTDDFGHGD